MSLTLPGQIMTTVFIRLFAISKGERKMSKI